MLLARRMDTSQKVDFLNEAAKGAPPAAVALSAHVLGLGLADWVAIATIAYIVLQASFLIWKWWRLSRDRKALRKDADD